jgi:hypothetical protein
MMTFEPMPKKPFKRVHRSRTVSTDKAGRDAELRHKIRNEFPPLEPSSASPLLSEPLKDAILRSKKTTRRLAKEAKVSLVILDQFNGRST